MKWALLTLTEKTSLSKYFLLFLCVFFSTHSLIFSLEPTTGDEEEMWLYTKAREKEEKMGAQYMADAMRGFSKKLDKAIKKDVELAKFFKKWYCDGCDSVVSPDLDQAMIDYLSTVPALTKSIPYDFAAVVKPHLDPSISEVSNTDIRALNTLMNIMSDSIIGQVKEQMILSREIEPVGRYYDGDAQNSPYDIMASIQKLDSKYFNETPELWPYKNTSLTDIASLISGWSWLSGQWWSSDIVSDISSALGISVSWPVKWVAASSCSNGSCSLDTNIHMADFPINKSFVPDVRDSQGDTYQRIFEEWNEWMVKYWINRWNPCKIPPSWFFFQGLFDKNASGDDWLLAKMFSMWVYPVQEVPELLKWFMNRETRTRESEDKQIESSIARAFKGRWMNYEKPTEILVAGIERAVNRISRENSDNNLPVSSSVDALERGEGEYQKYIKSLWRGMEGTYLKEHSVASMDHIGVTLEEIKSRADLVNNSSKTLNTISDYLLSKGECQPS